VAVISVSYGEQPPSSGRLGGLRMMAAGLVTVSG
jgi:hypothetical protein